LLKITQKQQVKPKLQNIM